jgi:hypothetical protein
VQFVQQGERLPQRLKPSCRPSAKSVALTPNWCN